MTWERVHEIAMRGGQVMYRAPLDYRPRQVTIQGGAKNKTRVRVYPPTNNCDPFWADATHLDRFSEVRL